MEATTAIPREATHRKEEVITDDPPAYDYKLAYLKYGYEHMRRRARSWEGRGGWMAELHRNQMEIQKGAITRHTNILVDKAVEILSVKDRMYNDVCISTTLRAHKIWKGATATIIESTTKSGTCLREGLAPLIIAPTHRPGVPGHWVTYVLTRGAEQEPYVWHYGDSLHGTHRDREVDRILSMLNATHPGGGHIRPVTVQKLNVPRQIDTRSCGVYATEAGVRAIDGFLTSGEWEDLHNIRDRHYRLVQTYCD
jgi:hypothetical protein